MSKLNQDSYELILKQTSGKKASVFALKKTYPAYIILFIFLIVSFLIRFAAAKSIETNLNNEFEKTITSVMNRLNAHHSKQIEVLNSMNGLYDLLVEVVKDYFELYATIPSKNYPSILSVSYVPQVLNADLDRFITNARSLGYYNYELKSDTTHSIYFPFVNIVPEVKNIHRLGIDLAEDKIAMDAIYKARNSNQMTATEVYTLRQPDTVGFYVFYPVYFRNTLRETTEDRKKNFQAALCLEINLNKFIDEALSGNGKKESTAAPADTTIIFEITGNHKDGSEYSVYKSKNYKLLSGFTPLLSDTSILKIADKDFKVKYYTIPNYGGKLQQFLPNLSLIVSIIISFAFFGFVLTQLTNKAKAQEIADTMTRSQRRIVDTSNDMIAVLDSNLVWKTMNPASLAILGIMPDEMTGKKFSFNILDKNIENKIFEYYSTSKEDHVERLDMQMSKTDGTVVWIDWSFTFSIEDGLIYCIGRDVTLEKQAEADSRLRSKQIEATEIVSREANFSKSYFMKEMSHQLRNSLTGILGYLQLLQAKMFDSEDEVDMYVDMATSSSEELFTYVTDIDEAAKLNEVDTSSLTLQTVDLGIVIKNSINEFKNSEMNSSVIAEFNVENANISAMVIGDNAYIKSIIDDSISLMTEGNDNITFDINAEANPYEGAVELQILSSGNKTVFELIDIYKKNSENIIEALKYDKNDVLLKLHKISSTLRLLRGSFKIDTFGEKEGNLISIIFKSNKKFH
jgi:PAS domain S-box-containing protein